MSGISFKVSGADKILSKFSKLPKQLQDGIHSEIVATSEEVAEGVRRDAPVDESFLLHSVSTKNEGQTQSSVIAQSSYGAYLEFGTKSLVDVPAGLEAIAGQFKGPGNNGSTDPLKAIQGWVGRKIGGTPKEQKSIAWLIWRKIRTVGIKPHPFFFKQAEEARPKFISRIKQVIKDAL